MESKKQKNIERLEKALPEHFVDSVRASNESHLKDMIVTLSQEIENIDEMMKSDPTLQSLREQIKDLSGGYRDAKRDKQNRLKYILAVLESKGKL